MKQSIDATEYTTSTPQTGIEVTTNVTLKFSDGLKITISAEEAKQLMRELNKQFGYSGKDVLRESFPAPNIPNPNTPFYQGDEPIV